MAQAPGREGGFCYHTQTVQMLQKRFGAACPSKRSYMTTCNAVWPGHKTSSGILTAAASLYFSRAFVFLVGLGFRVDRWMFDSDSGWPGPLPPRDALLHMTRRRNTFSLHHALHTWSYTTSATDVPDMDISCGCICVFERSGGTAVVARIQGPFKACAECRSIVSDCSGDMVHHDCLFCRCSPPHRTASSSSANRAERRGPQKKVQLRMDSVLYITASQ